MRYTLLAAAAAVIAVQQAPFTIAATPMLAIGTEDGPEATQLSRVYGARRLPDGTIAIGNTGSSQLRLFDATGTFRKSVGGRGAGPGEFAQYTSVNPVLVGRDRVYIDDSGNRRVNVYDLGGAYLRTFQFDGVTDQGWAAIAGIAGKNIVGKSIQNAVLRGAPGSLIVSKYNFALYDTTGHRLKALFEAVANPRIVHEYRGTTHYPFLPLTEPALVVSSADKIYLLRNEVPSIEVWDLDGRQLPSITWPATLAETREVWPRVKATALASYVKMSAEEKARGSNWLYEHFYQMELPLRKHVAIAQYMAMSDDGNIWIGRYRLPDDKVRRWDVVTTAGKYLGQVTTPLNLEVFQIGADFILGRARNDLDVEQVQLFRLTRN